MAGKFTYGLDCVAGSAGVGAGLAPALLAGSANAPFEGITDGSKLRGSCISFSHFSFRISIFAPGLSALSCASELLAAMRQTRDAKQHFIRIGFLLLKLPTISATVAVTLSRCDPNQT